LAVSRTRLDRRALLVDHRDSWSESGTLMDKVVDIADLQVSKDPKADLVTYSLGSCIGVAIWDPEVRVGGMLHYMLPQSSISPEKAKANPAMFADTGIPQLFRSAYELGAIKKRMIVKVAGGSSLLDDNGTFNIGKTQLHHPAQDLLEKTASLSMPKTSAERSAARCDWNWKPVE
jgi:chemotaxis receptor (MCP) glutamine deamidase CheD